MTIGPLEFIVIGFPGNNFHGEIFPEMEYLREHGIVRIVDLVFVTKDGEGNVSSVEVTDLKGEAAARYGSIIGDLVGLLTAEDVATAASDIPANSSAALLLFEHRWAVRLKEAVLRADGVLLSQARIAPETLEEVAAELALAQ